MQSPADLTGPVNLGNPVEFTMIDLARKIIAQCGSSSELSFKPLPEDDPRQRQPDIGLAKRTLGWMPTVALDAGLQKTIEYFRSAAAP
jgi:UDP-glucuronate decarboxylase